jgi:mannosyltransferase OCH1-like enzyme
MIPAVVHQTARVKPLHGEAALLQRRAARILGWKFELHDDHDNHALVRRYLPQYEESYSRIERGVVKADIARLLYVYVFGGFYLDTDYKVLRNFAFLREREAVLTISGEEDPASPAFQVCNSFIASVPGYPLWRDFIDHIFAADVETLAECEVEQATGPAGLTRFLRLRIEAYPGLFLAPRKQFAPRITHFGLWYDTSGDPYGAHICHGSWRSKSPLRRLKDRVVRAVTARI